MRTKNETMNSSMVQLAAKSNAESREWLPLYVHSLDTCGIAEKLYFEWLPIQARQIIGQEIEKERITCLIRTIALLHDLGKATAGFQTKISKNNSLLRDQLLRNNIPILPEKEESQQGAGNFYHAAAGEVLLLIENCPLSFAEVIGAHHGQPWPLGDELLEELKGNEDWADPRAISLWGNREQHPVWRDIQKECFRWMLAMGGYDAVQDLPEISQPTAVLLTGLVIMADWIASNENYFPVIPLQQTDRGDIGERIETGWKKIDLPPAWVFPETDSYSEISMNQFGFLPNSVQEAVLLAIQNSRKPGLFILEAPMGCGKTEAALLASDLLSMRGSGGVFFGLPTQATANAIFDRVIQWGESQPGGNRISIRLAHGMAEMNARYQALMRGSGLSRTEEDGGSDKLTVHEWFRGRKQALLADFVIGTVDQVLMAALRQKHIMLRHLGLCGKTIIIDECHAYDAYMNQYLEEALSWLGRYGTPVIMLSATLPKERRGAFLAAYLTKSIRERRKQRKEAWFDNLAYPILTWTDGNTICQQELKYDGKTKEVQILKISKGETVEEQAEATADLLREALRNGGCAAVVLNTVRRAQAFAKSIRDILPQMTVLLLHSRFVTQDRLRHEEELLRRMGKKSGKSERDKVIVIGTQVIEQSLDFDADIMISDLCPMDLLLQRIGRLHRHSVHNEMRPEQLGRPVCYVLSPEKKIDPGSKMVYGEYLLLRTKALLPEVISLPSDIALLVNEVYDDEKKLSEEPPGYEKAREEQIIRQNTLKQDANAFRIHGPEQRYSDLLTGKIPDGDEHARAQVRAGEFTMDVLLMMRLQNGELCPVPWLRKDESWDTDNIPSIEDSRKMLEQRISLTTGLLNTLLRSMKWEELIQQLAVPKKWEESVWMKNSHILILNSEMKAELGDLVLSYDEEMGLQWKQEGDRA